MKRQAAGERRRLSHGLHSDTGVSLAQRPSQSSACCGSGGADRRPPDPETAEESGTDGASVSVFMPEFPQCQSPEQDHFQVMLTQNTSLLSENLEAGVAETLGLLRSCALRSSASLLKAHMDPSWRWRTISTTRSLLLRLVVNNARNVYFLIYKTLCSCISLLLSGSTEVEGGEAGSSGAAERRSHHPGITMYNCQLHYDGNTRWKYTFQVSEDQKWFQNQCWTFKSS